MPRPTDYRNPETNMHGTLKHTITRFRKPIPVFPSGQKTRAARDGNGSAARNAKRQFFRCSDGTEERQTPRGVPKRPKDGPAQPAIRSRKDGEALPPVETTTTARHARPAESGRKDKEPDRLKRKPTDTRRAYKSRGIPVPHAQNRGMPHSIRLRPRIRTGTRPKASDRLRLNRAVRP
mgnify:CR=1 FL=1